MHSNQNNPNQINTSSVFISISRHLLENNSHKVHSCNAANHIKAQEPSKEQQKHCLHFPKQKFLMSSHFSRQLLRQLQKLFS